jgi:hydroxypyruvate reductase
MIDILQLAQLRPEIQQEMEKRYRVHAPSALDSVANKVQGVVTIAGSGPDAALIDKLPKLEIIAAGSVGYDSIDVEHARKKGIPVTNTPGVLDDDVADLAITLMVMTARRLVASDRHVRDSKWLKDKYPLTRTASNKRVGILGMGRIGRAIAKRAEAMNNSIAYHTRKPVTDLPYRHYPSLVELARASDFLVAIIPGTPETAKIVNAAVLEALGPEGIFINVARGVIADEEALVAALQSGKLGGAGLDVFAEEPKVPEALFAMDNVVLAPHVGSATVETRRAMSQLVLDNLDAHFAGKPLLTPV